ncbi:MAG TPA: hypothetical protein DCS67_06490 [Clostridiales bacterium UBA8960]|jgi:hypothetical protein|nr:hypothetical protein [Clostridiales bacterium UBA8960]
MSVSLEKIDMLMERANISYKEAKEALELHDGDMVEALIHLEASNKTAKGKAGQKANGNKGQAHAHVHMRRQGKSNSDFMDDVKKFFEKMHKTSFVVGNKSKRILDIPLTIAALLILFTMPVSMFILILPYLFGYKISVLDTEGKNFDFEKAFTFGDEKKDEDRME